MLKYDEWSNNFNSIVEETRTNLNKIKTNNFKESLNDKSSIQLQSHENVSNLERLQKNLSAINSIEIFKPKVSSFYNYNEFRNVLSFLVQSQRNGIKYIQMENFIKKFNQNADYENQVDEFVKIVSDKMNKLEKRNLSLHQKLNDLEVAQKELTIYLNSKAHLTSYQPASMLLHSNWNNPKDIGFPSHNIDDNDLSTRPNFMTPPKIINPENFLRTLANNGVEHDTNYNGYNNNNYTDNNYDYANSAFRPIVNSRNQEIFNVKSKNNNNNSNNNNINNNNNNDFNDDNEYDLSEMNRIKYFDGLRDDCYRTIHSLKLEYERNRRELKALEDEGFHTPSFIHEYLFRIKPKLDTAQSPASPTLSSSLISSPVDWSVNGRLSISDLN
ncbi:hypothetical protein HELRODRAFT_173718 [Helobdella robusta]|uniref:Uncharacterized protein n=1 Tax=Helobdella robusta TaxID=6412 RepID=T1F757_HELRO|nr:hypothetical protein HELRODRAFT_173718 [Helobdella robusta]ESO03423.1 hypothetical protein HELRODRAFT_173718 [Helobdella robusta]